MYDPISPAEDAFHVLVVDDSLANLRLVSSVLREHGITPRPISSGALALAMARADPPDMVLLDIDLPGMDGFEVCQAFQEDPGLAAIPIIFISGLTDTSGIVKALTMGGVDYITKPFRAEEVAARVRTHLRILRLQRHIQAQNLDLERQVAERTRQLAQANQRLEELSALKDEFFTMFAHEIRTPANGLFGMCELIADLCMPSADLERYRGLYASSKARLLGLIEDMALIAGVSVDREGMTRPFIEVFRELRATVPEVPVVIQGPPLPAGMRIHEERGLLVRSLSTVFRMAACFRNSTHPIPITFAWEAGLLRMSLTLDRLGHSTAELEDFFRLESHVRSASYAEPLGLAPVAAHRILAALGGRLWLEPSGDGGGQIHVEIPAEPGRITPPSAPV